MNQDDPSTQSEPAGAPDRKTATALIFGIIFLDMMGIGLIAPLTPYITANFGGTAIEVGILTSCYSGAQFLASPVLGALSDRFGRRPILIISLIGTSIGYFIFASAKVFWLLVAARVLDGVTGGNISTAQAYIADITPPKDRAKMFGMMGAAFGLGFTLGPALGALLAGLGQMAPIYAAGVLSLVAAGLVALKLPETLPPSRRTKGAVTFATLNPAASMAKARAIHGVPIFLLIVFVLSLAHAELRSSLGIYAKNRFGFNEQKADLMFAFMGIIAIIVQGGLVRVLAKHVKDRVLVLLALPIAAAGFALMPFPHTVWGMLAGLAIAALGMGLAGPNLNGMLSRASGERAQGIAMGASQSASSLALVIGPMIATPLYDHAGKMWPFLSAGAFILIAWAVFAAVRPQAPDAAPVAV